MSVFELTNLQAYIAIGASCRVQGAQCVCAMPGSQVEVGKTEKKTKEKYRKNKEKTN